MPKQKDLKRLVRARMQKTGESYTTARLHLVRNVGRTLTPSAGRVGEPVPHDYAKLAGMSDEAVKKATGCTWKRWVTALDHAGATKMSHGELAQHIHAKYHTPSWWTQTVAVGYERIRGLRARGQQRSGDWSVSKSKTIAAPVAKVYAAFKSLDGLKLSVRTARPSKSLRIRWEDGSAVDVMFTARGASKSQIAIDHRKLATKADADRMRAFWTERLEALASQMRT